jgi:vacuolar-type H+-ATPase subunit H
MQALATKYAMGISIDQVQLKNINPPEPVQASFNEVNQAQQEKERLINEARREYNKVIPLAEGEKDQRIREADGYRLKRINEAEGDAARFSALLEAYLNAPGGHAAAHLHRDDAGGPARHPLQDHRGRIDAQHPAAARPRPPKGDAP